MHRNWCTGFDWSTPEGKLVKQVFLYEFSQTLLFELGPETACDTIQVQLVKNVMFADSTVVVVYVLACDVIMYDHVILFFMLIR